MKHPNTIQPKSEEECTCWYTEDGKPAPTADELDEYGMCKHGFRVGKPFHPRESSGEEKKCFCGDYTENIVHRKDAPCYLESTPAFTDTEWSSKFDEKFGWFFDNQTIEQVIEDRYKNCIKQRQADYIDDCAKIINLPRPN